MHAGEGRAELHNVLRRKRAAGSAGRCVARIAYRDYPVQMDGAEQVGCPEPETWVEDFILDAPAEGVIAEPDPAGISQPVGQPPSRFLVQPP